MNTWNFGTSNAGCVDRDITHTRSQDIVGVRYQRQVNERKRLISTLLLFRERETPNYLAHHTPIEADHRAFC